MSAPEANESGGSTAEPQTLVELQVGPSLFYATRRTLSKCPVLQRMLVAQESRGAHVAEDGGANLESPRRRPRAHRLLLDCEPAVFSLVIAYLRTGEIDSTCLIEDRRSPSVNADARVHEHTLRQEFRLLQLPWPRRCMRCGYFYNHQLYTQVPEVTSDQEELTIGQEELPVCYVHPGELREHPSVHAPLYSCCGREEGELGCTARRHCSAQDKGSGSLQNWGCAAPRSAHEGQQPANKLPQKTQVMPRQEEPAQEQEKEQPLRGLGSGVSPGGMSDTAAFVAQPLARKAADETEKSSPTFSALSCPAELGVPLRTAAATPAAETAEATKEGSLSLQGDCAAQGEGRQPDRLALPAGALATARRDAGRQSPEQEQHEPCWMAPSSQLVPYGVEPVVAGDTRGCLYARYSDPTAGRMAAEEAEEEQQRKRLSPPYCMAVPQQYLPEQQGLGYSNAGTLPPGGPPFCPQGLWSCDYVQLQQLPTQQQVLYCPFGCRYAPGGWECMLPPQRAYQGGPEAPGAMPYGSPPSGLPSASTSAETPPIPREEGGAVSIGASGGQRPSWGPRRCRGKRCPRGPSACEGPLGEGYPSCAIGSGDIEDVREVPELHRELKQGPSDGPRSPVGCFMGGRTGSAKTTSRSFGLERKNASTAATLPEVDSRCASRATPRGDSRAPEDATATPDEASPSHSGATHVQQQHQYRGEPVSVCRDPLSCSSGAKSKSLDLHPDSQEQEQEHQPGGHHQQQRLKVRSNSKTQGVPAAPTPNPLFKTRMCQMYKNGLCHQTSRRCKFAHALRELRSTSDLYKTGLCAFWASGFCKAGSLCRHAHGEGEMRKKFPEECPARVMACTSISRTCSLQHQEEEHNQKALHRPSSSCTLSGDDDERKAEQMEELQSRAAVGGTTD